MDRRRINVTSFGGFWLRFQNLVRDRVIPYQWKAMNDEIPGAPKSNSVRNFRLAAGRAAGVYEGMVFQDSDLYKWLEAVGNLAPEPGEIESLQRWVDEVVDLIEAAQLDDGYLNTYFIVNDQSKRWSNLRDAHELYCAGHLIEAAVALAQSGRGDRLLDVARRFADLIDATFGREAGKKPGSPGHEEIELALIKLYRYTGEKKYLERARYFIEERGSTPHFFEREAEAPGFASIFGARNLSYYQAHVPLREQREAVGHAVRAMYLYAAAADLAQESKDSELRAACDLLWENVTSRKMYVTGGIGSSWVHESFGPEFDLPNDTAYAETCAAIGLFLFSSRMLRLHHQSKYADVMERCLYNGILSGLALDGESYFYVNPLEVDPRVCDGNPSYEAIKYRRQPWYGCACCPPNIARTLTGLGQHLYHVDGRTLYVDLYHNGTAAVDLEGSHISLRQVTDYPWSGNITLELETAEPTELTLALRVPEWCTRAPLVRLAGVPVAEAPSSDGYILLHRVWEPGDRVDLTYPMEVSRVHADPRVRADFGKVAIQRGPIVYCLEEVDNGSGLFSVRLPEDADLAAVERPDLLGGIVTVTATGEVTTTGEPHGRPYGFGDLKARSAGPKTKSTPLLFIPYFAWANRSPGEMIVWIRE